MHARRRTVSVTLSVAFAMLVATHAAAAQRAQGLVEVGATHLRQADVAATDAATVGAAVRSDGRRYSLTAAGGVTIADEGRSTTQGLLAASLLGRPGGRTRWEIGGALTAFDEGSLSASTGAYALVREHLTISDGGGWVGMAIGGVDDAGAWNPTRTFELASWLAHRGGRLSAAAVVVDTRSEPYGSEGQLVTDPITYTDATLGGRWGFRSKIELDLRAGMRFISRGALTPTGRGTRSFAAADAAVWVTPRVAVVASLGRQLSDLARGTPDTRFAAIALRVAMHNRAAAPVRRDPAPITAPFRLTLVSDSTGGSRLVAAFPEGAVVELAATFTNWEPVPLVRRGEAWELDRPLPAGVHRVLVRVDGGPWIVPANLPAMADDFGGTVGIITVP